MRRRPAALQHGATLHPKEMVPVTFPLIQAQIIISLLDQRAKPLEAVHCNEILHVIVFFCFAVISFCALSFNHQPAQQIPNRIEGVDNYLTSSTGGLAGVQGRLEKKIKYCAPSALGIKVMISNTFTPHYSFGEESYLGTSCDCTKVSCDIKPSIVWYRHRKRPWLAIIDKGLGSLVFFLMVLQCDKKLSLRLVSVASLTFQVQSTLRHSIGWKNVLRRIGKVWNKMNVLSHHHQTLPIVPYNRRATPASWGPIQVFTGTHFLYVIDL